MRIALFEDNDEHAQKVLAMIEKWSRLSGTVSTAMRFGSPFEAGDLACFDCILLDVEMPGMNGVEFAREIRTSGSKIPIVFISSHTQYSIDGYEVNALRFIDKGSTLFERKFYECMDKVAYEVKNSFNAFYCIRSSKKLIRIAMHEILYFEISDHELVTHTVSGTFNERKTFAELKRELPKQFVQIGRSLMINVLQAAQMTKKYVVLRNGMTLPIAPKYLNDLFEAYLDMC